jgi:hypothetical protein
MPLQVFEVLPYVDDVMTKAPFRVAYNILHAYAFHCPWVSQVDADLA